jgi:hypothetical protein
VSFPLGIEGVTIEERLLTCQDEEKHPDHQGLAKGMRL